ncbi:MAG: hypothetical protein WCG83_06915 [Candidatus Peregrinibacteria bacterium]
MEKKLKDSDSLRNGDADPIHSEKIGIALNQGDDVEQIYEKFIAGHSIEMQLDFLNDLVLWIERNAMVYQQYRSKEEYELMDRCGKRRQNAQQIHSRILTNAMVALQGLQPASSSVVDSEVQDVHDHLLETGTAERQE